MHHHELPLFTQAFSTVEDFSPVGESVYVSARSVEQRSEHISAWATKAADVNFVEVTGEDRHFVTLGRFGGGVDRVALRSNDQIRRLWDRIRRPTIYIDITGLRHHVWAVLVRSALETNSRVIAIYVEPADYRTSLAPTENQIYDLSERIEGIRPLPGFARTRDTGENSCFVPLLGFEGTRVSYIISQLEPPGGKIIPIIGVPGFRPEYPFASYLGNRTHLLQTQAWKKVRYALANCPFDLFYVLQDIHREYPGHVLKIAPVGTKPHALGGILYAIANPMSVELVYDHPIRKAERTAGTARLLAYHLSSLFD
jgi:hypothetical protein